MLVALFGVMATDRAAALDAKTEPALSGLFKLSIGGVKAGEVRIDGTTREGRYRIAASIGTAGVVRTFYKAGIDAEVEGAADEAGLAPQRFQSRSFDPDKTRNVEMRYADGAPAVAAEPAYDPKPWELDPATQTGTLDPLSAALTAFAPRPAGELCDRTVRIFDARRLFAVSLEAESRPQRGVITCEAAYVRLGGFKPKMLAKPPFPFRVEFVERTDGLWEIERAVGPTPVGQAVLARVR